MSLIKSIVIIIQGLIEEMLGYLLLSLATKLILKSSGFQSILLFSILILGFIVLILGFWDVLRGVVRILLRWRE